MLSFNLKELALKHTPKVTLYSRPGCHLCEEARSEIRHARRTVSFSFNEINIESELMLLDLYRYDIPVVSIDDTAMFKHHLTAEELVRALRATQSNRNEP
jgi:hypothetical protein